MEFNKVYCRVPFALQMGWKSRIIMKLKVYERNVKELNYNERVKATRKNIRTVSHTREC